MNGTNSATFIVDMFFYLLEAYFVQELFCEERNEDRNCNPLPLPLWIWFLFIENFLKVIEDVKCMHVSFGIKTKDTIDTVNVLYIVTYILKLTPRSVLNDSRGHFNFSIVNISILCNIILATPPYGVYINQWIRYPRFGFKSFVIFQNTELLLIKAIL